MVMIRGRILLGGIVDIEEVTASAAALRSDLQVVQREYWNQRPYITPEVVETYCSPDRLLDGTE